MKTKRDSSQRRRGEVIEAWLHGVDAKRLGLRSRDSVLYSVEAVIGTLDDQGRPTTYQPQAWTAGTLAHLRSVEAVLSRAAASQAPDWWTRCPGPADQDADAADPASPTKLHK